MMTRPTMRSVSATGAAILACMIQVVCFSVLAADTFFGLEQSAGSFAAVRMVLTPRPDSGFSPTIDDFRFEATAVPEPSSFGLLGLGAGGLLLAWRRRASRSRSCQQRMVSKNS